MILEGNDNAETLGDDSFVFWGLFLEPISLAL